MSYCGNNTKISKNSKTVTNENAKEIPEADISLQNKIQEIFDDLRLK